MNAEAEESRRPHVERPLRHAVVYSRPESAACLLAACLVTGCTTGCNNLVVDVVTSSFVGVGTRRDSLL